MANRTPREPAKAQPPAATPTPGAWGWLQNPANQKTLRFIGAGIVAAAGLLATIGFIHKPEPTPIKPLPASSTSQAATALAPAQTAVASGGNATNIIGNGNQVGTGNP
jgi:hypothetical protein